MNVLGAGSLDLPLDETRWAARLSAGLVVGLLLLVMSFAVVAALIGRSQSLDLAEAVGRADSFDDLRSALDREHLLAVGYLLAPGATSSAHVTAAFDEVERSLRIAAQRDAGDIPDLIALDRIRGLQVQYEAAALRMLAAVDAGENARADPLAVVTARIFEEIQGSTAHLARVHRDEAAPRLAALERISTLFALLTPAALIATLLFLFLFGRRWRRANEILVVAETESRTKLAILGRISHEFRTPLNAILGFSQMVLERGDLNERDSRDLGKVRSSGQRLLYLVDEVLGITDAAAR